MWGALACIGLGMSGLTSASQTDGGNAPVAGKHAVLELMSLDAGDYTLKLEHRWGGISGNHVYFDNHDGQFEAIVEPSPSGVRVTFNGWEEHPFVATSARMRVIYRRPGADPVDILAEAMPDGGKVRIRPAGRPPVQGKKISIRLGRPEVQYFPSQHK